MYTHPWKPEEGILASGLESQAAVTARRGCWEPSHPLEGQQVLRTAELQASLLSHSYFVFHELSAYALCSCYLEHKVLFMTSVSVIFNHVPDG